MRQDRADALEASRELLAEDALDVIRDAEKLIDAHDAQLRAAKSAHPAQRCVSAPADRARVPRPTDLPSVTMATHASRHP